MSDVIDGSPVMCHLMSNVMEHTRRTDDMEALTLQFQFVSVSSLSNVIIVANIKHCDVALLNLWHKEIAKERLVGRIGRRIGLSNAIRAAELYFGREIASKLYSSSEAATAEMEKLQTHWYDFEHSKKIDRQYALSNSKGDRIGRLLAPGGIKKALVPT